MILKAGTYRFNDVLIDLILVQDGYLIDFEYNGTQYNRILTDESSQEMQFEILVDGDVDDGILVYSNGSWLVSVPVFITLSKDTEVVDTFGTWYISNTNYNEVNATPLATIEYNGQTIAQLNAGETCIIKCGPTEDTEYKMASDIAVKIESGYVKPSGSVTITENTTTDVTNVKEVVTNVPIPEGYIKPEGTLEITLNNIEAAYPIDCSQYAKVTVNTAEPLRISDPTVLDNITDSPWGVGGSVFLYEGTTTDTYEKDALYYLEDTEK